MVAKPAAGGAYVYGTWAMEAPSTYELATKLFEAWGPTAPSSERGKKILEIRTKIAALDKDAKSRTLDVFGPR